MHLKKIKNNVIYYVFFPKYIFEKKTPFLIKIASVILHISKEFRWQCIFRSATIF